MTVVPAPEPLPADAFDSHCHLDLIERPVPEVLADARAARITRVVTIGVDLPTSRWAADCADGSERSRPGAGGAGSRRRSGRQPLGAQRT